jgi:hypothetical protein
LQLDESPEQCLGVDILASGQLFLPSAIEVGLHALWVWYPGAVERSAARRPRGVARSWFVCGTAENEREIYKRSRLC